jgi:hypothetical protein
VCVCVCVCACVCVCVCVCVWVCVCDCSTESTHTASPPHCPTRRQSLLDEPNPNSPANSGAAQLYTENRREYEKMVRKCVEQSLEDVDDDDGDDGDEGDEGEGAGAAAAAAADEHGAAAMQA